MQTCCKHESLIKYIKFQLLGNFIVETTKITHIIKLTCIMKKCNSKVICNAKEREREKDKIR